MMKVNLTKIKIKPPEMLAFSFVETLDASAYQYDDFCVLGDAAVKGTIVNRGESDFLATFSYEAQIELICSRCGKAFSLPVSGAAKAHFTPEPQTEEDGEESVFPVEAASADLAAAVLNEIYFRLPMQPLCHEACRGLCPICGTDLNEHSCSCQDDTIDPRWEKLKNLRMQD